MATNNKTRNVVEEGFNIGSTLYFFLFFFFQLCIFAYKDIRQGRGWAGGMSNDILTMTLFVKETCFTANIL